MDERLLIGAFGALVGALGWLGVALIMERRAATKRARDAGRAVYFELRANHLHVLTARDHNVFGELSRATYERLLPEMATWLPARDLETLVEAYMGHAGYAQASTDQKVPDAVRRHLLGIVAERQAEAIAILRRRVFNKDEQAWLARHVAAEAAVAGEASAKATPARSTR